MYACVDNVDQSGFFSSGFRFDQVTKDGWHHLGAVGHMQQHPLISNPYGQTTYYLDGEVVGSVPYNLRTSIAYIGNVSEEEYGLLSQQWGIIADLRIFQRALSKDNVHLLIPKDMIGNQNLHA